MNISSPPPVSAQAKQRGWRPFLLAFIGFVALLAAACLGSFAASHAAEPGAARGDTPAGSAAPETATPVPARWVKKKINFVYQGFTTHYSCDGLTDKVKQVLLELGARKSDLHIHESGCTRGFGRPEPSPGVMGTFSVLEPVSGSGAESAGSAGNASGVAGKHAVKATWQTVHVHVGERGLDESGQCELIDQVKARILPLFSTRDVQFRQNCFPHQLMIKGSTLTVQVLKPAGRSNEVAQASR